MGEHFNDGCNCVVLYPSGQGCSTFTKFIHCLACLCTPAASTELSVVQPLCSAAHYRQRRKGRCDGRGAPPDVFRLHRHLGTRTSATSLVFASMAAANWRARSSSMTTASASMRPRMSDISLYILRGPTTQSRKYIWSGVFGRAFPKERHQFQQPGNIAAQECVQRRHRVSAREQGFGPREKYADGVGQLLFYRIPAVDLHVWNLYRA